MKMKEALYKVEAEASKSYEKFKPLIQYFERAEILLPLNNGLGYTQRKNISDDFFKLKDACKKMADA